TAQCKCRDDSRADDSNELPLLAIEDVVDDVFHDPRAEGGGAGDRQHAQPGQKILRDEIAAVFRKHAADHRYDLACFGFPLPLAQLTVRIAEPALEQAL